MYRVACPHDNCGFVFYESFTSPSMAELVSAKIRTYRHCEVAHPAAEPRLVVLQQPYNDCDYE